MTVLVSTGLGPQVSACTVALSLWAVVPSFYWVAVDHQHALQIERPQQGADHMKTMTTLSTAPFSSQGPDHAIIADVSVLPQQVLVGTYWHHKYVSGYQTSHGPLTCQPFHNRQLTHPRQFSNLLNFTLVFVFLTQDIIHHQQDLSDKTLCLVSTIWSRWPAGTYHWWAMHCWQS